MSEISGAKFSDVFDVEEEVSSVSTKTREYKEYTKVPQEKAKKARTKKLKNILKDRKNVHVQFLTSEDIERRILIFLSLFVKKEKDRHEILQLIKQSKTRVSNLSENENLLLLAYELYFSPIIKYRDLIKVKVDVKEENVKIKIKKKKYLNKKEFKSLKEYIQTSLFFFDTFEEYKIIEREIDSYIENPIDISSGVIICQHCGSDKTLSWQKQIRRADEPMTTFFHCMKCNRGGKLSS